VLENLSNLVIKPAFPRAGSDPWFTGEMSRAQLELLAARINAHPINFVAQERIESRSAPVLFNDKMQSRRFVMRAYLAAADGSYTVMHGGLTRVTAENSEVVSLQIGGGSKDTWILSDRPVMEQSLLTPATHAVELNRGGGDLPSRVADDLFWLGRYVNRAESDVRIARCLLGRVNDQTRGEEPGIAQLLATQLLGKPKFNLDEGNAFALVAEVFRPDPTGGVRSAIDHVEELLRSLRDRVSADAWRTLQRMEQDLSEFDRCNKADQSTRVAGLLNRLAIHFLAFSGVISESMTRGFAWRFLDMGCRFERAIALSRLLRSTLGHVITDEPALLDAILEITDSSLTYRRRYFTHLDVAAVVDLLVADEGNPRSIAYQAGMIDEHLASLPGHAMHPQQSPHTQLILELRTRIRLAKLQDECAVNDKRARPKLVALMAEIIEKLQQIAEYVSQIYFSHAAIAQRLEGPGEAEVD
jgi:uncharacterized alpha-E superfamily protein